MKVSVARVAFWIPAFAGMSGVWDMLCDSDPIPKFVKPF
jgi:hypothetical protein